jgi:hypothetical protein
MLIDPYGIMIREPIQQMILYDTSESIYCLTKDRLMYGYPDDDPGEE